jgi:DNA-binding MarR family transcriptional regulator
MAAAVFEELVAEINTLNTLLRKHAARQLRSESLAPAELRVLQILHERGPQTVPDIGRFRLTSRQNIQITVNRLKNAGLVELSPNPAHKRSDLVRLTGAGQGTLDRAPTTQTLFADGPEGMSVEEATHALEYMRKLRNALAPERKKRAARIRKQLTAPEKGPSADSSARPAPGAEEKGATRPVAPFEDELPVNLL